jgi:hypothetical protein
MLTLPSPVGYSWVVPCTCDAWASEPVMTLSLNGVALAAAGNASSAGRESTAARRRARSMPPKLEVNP